MLTLAASQFTAFHVVGIIFACWAVLVTALGITRPDFPGSAERVVLGISVLLAVSTVGLAIGTVKGEKKEQAEAATSKAKANPKPSLSAGAAALTFTQ